MSHLDSTARDDAADLVIWRVDLAAVPADAALLAPDERARAAGFATPTLRSRFTAAHVALRRVLAGETGIAPEAIRFRVGPHGKPDLGDSAAVRFNLSHAGDRALIATAPREVGVDIERTDRRADAATIAAAFHPAEVAAWERLPADARREAFFRLWVRKEAYAKARGHGLRVAFHASRVSVDAPPRLLEDGDDPGAPGTWSLADLESDVGTVAAVAIAGAMPTIRYRRFEG